MNIVDKGSASLKNKIIIAVIILITAISIRFIISTTEDKPDIEFLQSRQQLIAEIENYWNIEDKVLEAMLNVERHKYILEDFKEMAYLDLPIPIGFGQNTSAPHMIAHMTTLLELNEESRVLEVRTRAGYHTAILAELAKEVYTLEPVPELKDLAADNLKQDGYNNIYFKSGDGYLGWPGEAPFDAIVVKGASEEIPFFLLDQIVEGGHMVIPIGPLEGPQMLCQIVKERDGYIKNEIGKVNFIPLNWEPDYFI